MLQFLPWVHLACAIVVTLALAFVVILEWRTYLETKRTLGNLLGAAALVFVVVVVLMLAVWL